MTERCADCARFTQDCATSGWCRIAFDRNLRDPVMGRQLLDESCSYFKSRDGETSRASEEKK